MDAATGCLSTHLSSLRAYRSSGSCARRSRFFPRAVGREPCERGWVGEGGGRRRVGGRGAGLVLREGRRGGARRRWNRSRRIGSIEEGCALVVDDAGDSGSGAGPDVGGVSEGLCVARAWGSVRAIKIFHRSSPRVVLLPDAHARSGAGVTRGRGASGATRARRWRAEIEASRATGWIRAGRARGEGSSAHPGALAGHVEASSCGRACPRAGVEVRQGHDDALLVPRLQRRRDCHFSDSIARLARSRARRKY